MENKYKSHPTIKIIIDGIEYGATAFLSVRDMKFISDIDFQSESIDYKEISLSILCAHLIDFPDEKIQNDAIYESELERFIDTYICSSEELQNIYTVIEVVDIPTRFVLCLKKRTADIGKQMAENLSPVLQHFAKTIKIAVPTMPQLVVTQQLKESMNAITKIYSDTMKNSLTIMAQTLSESIRRMIPDYSQVMNGLSQTITKYAEMLKSPLLSYEREKNLQDSFAQWGKFGWTLPPNADLELFFEKPLDEKDAYKRVKPYINKGGMQMLFDMLLQMKHIRKSDLKEAIADYEEKRYKSCIMILFSLIDARIIRLQEVKEGKRRPYGYKGANAFFEKIEAEEIIEMTFADVLYKYSILSSLSVVFETGNDFRKQPCEINRNFVDHGMLHRNVTQRDCKKIFLLLYNFYALVDDLVGYE